MLEKYISQVLKRPALIMIAALIVATVASMGAGSLSFRSDERVFFSEDNPYLAKLDAFESRYGKENTILVVIHSAKGTVFTPDTLQALAEIGDDLWTAPYVKRVNSPVNFRSATGDADGMIVDQLWRKGDLTDPATLARLEKQAKDMPLMMHRLLSSDMKTAMVAVNYRIPEELTQSAADGVVADIRTRLADYRQKYSGLDFHMSGSLALDAAFGEASEQDSKILIPIMFTLFLVFLAILLRSAIPVIGIFLVIGASIGGALGIGGFLGLPLSSVSVVSPFIITILALADAVHFSFAAFKARRDGVDRKESVAIALRKTAMPIALTSATTAVGFFSLLFSESPPFAHLGVFSGVGVLLAWFFSMTIIPTLMVLLPWKAGPVIDKNIERFRRVGQWVADRPVVAMLAALVPALVLIAFIGQNKLDDRYVHYFDERFEFRIDTNALNEYLGGFYSLEYDLKTDHSGGVFKYQYLDEVDRLTAWFREQDEVTHVSSLSDRIKMMHRALQDGNQAEYRIPEDSEVSAQIFALYEMQLPYGFDMKEQLLLDKSSSRMTISLKDLSTGDILALSQRASDWIHANTPGLSQSAEATGTTVLFAYIGMRNIENMLWGTLVAFITIGLLMLLAFRNIGITLVAFVANIIPGLAAIGGWGFFVGEVGMTVATILAVTLGIVVDDTIHIVASLREEMAKGKTAHEAVPLALSHVGPAISATTFSLALGFFVLATSGFQINAWLGLMTGIVALIAYVFDLLFIPAAFILLTSCSAEKANTGATEKLLATE